MTNSHSMRLDVLADEPSPEVVGSLLRKALDITGRKTLLFDNVPEDSLILRFLPDAAAQYGYRYVVKKESQNCLVRIGRSFDAYYNGLVPKYRKNVNAAERKAGERGPLNILFPDSADQTLEFLNRGFDVELQSWKGKANSALSQRRDVGSSSTSRTATTPSTCSSPRSSPTRRRSLTTTSRGPSRSASA